MVNGTATYLPKRLPDPEGHARRDGDRQALCNVRHVIPSRQKVTILVRSGGVEIRFSQWTADSVRVRWLLTRKFGHYHRVIIDFYFPKDGLYRSVLMIFGHFDFHHEINRRNAEPPRTVTRLQLYRRLSGVFRKTGKGYLLFTERVGDRHSLHGNVKYRCMGCTNGRVQLWFVRNTNLEGIVSAKVAPTPGVYQL